MKKNLMLVAFLVCFAAIGCSEKPPVSTKPDATNKVTQGKGKSMGMTIEDK